MKLLFNWWQTLCLTHNNFNCNFLWQPKMLWNVFGEKKGWNNGFCKCKTCIDAILVQFGNFPTEQF